MGNITKLSQGNLDGLKKQVCECIDHAQAQGYKEGKNEPKEVKAVNVEDTMEYKIGYKVGFEDGTNRSLQGYYNKGLEDTWEMVRAIHDANIDEKEGLYGYCLTYEIVEKLDVHKAFEIYKNYEQAKQELQEKAKEEIKVGDEIEHLPTKQKGYLVGESPNYYKGIYPNPSNTYLPITIFDWSKEDCKKTGKHIDEVSQLLDKLKGDK